MLLERRVVTEADTERLGVMLATSLHAGLLLFLHGGLGAGKTTLVRGILHGLGYVGTVKSPTYTLVEPYDCAGLRINHFDLYRLKNAEELEFLGLRDYLESRSLCLMEWAERGAGVLPTPDVDISIETEERGRVVRFASQTENGAVLLRGFATALNGESATNAGAASPS